VTRGGRLTQACVPLYFQPCHLARGAETGPGQRCRAGCEVALGVAYLGRLRAVKVRVVAARGEQRGGADEAQDTDGDDVRLQAAER
jgi:hypothetical protein